MKILNYLRKSENSVAILLALTMLSLCFPYGFPLVSPLTAIFVAINLVHKDIKLRINVGFILFFICAVFYMLGMTMNGGTIYNLNKTDMTNIATLFLFWLLLSNLKKEDYPKLLHNFAKITVFISFIVSLISLYKFALLLNRITIPFFYIGDSYRNGTSLVNDYNMFSLGMFSGLVMTIYLLNKAKKTSHLIYYLIAFATIFSSIIFSGSRRGWVIAVVILIFLLFRGFKYLITHRFETNVVRFFKISFAASFILVFVILISVLFNVDIDIQNSPQVRILQDRFSTLQLDQVDDIFSSSRTRRWDHAEQMFGEYNPLQMVIGNGFSYIPEFGAEFTISNPESYPHSPIHSALLYSGLLGVLGIIFLVLWTFYKSLRHYSLFNIYLPLLLFINCVFIAISSNSIFSITSLLTLFLTVISVPDKQTPA